MPAAAGGSVQGWGTVLALSLATVAFAVVQPAILIFVPLALLLVAMPQRRPLLAAVSIGLAAAMFAFPADGGIWYLERGWALILGGWFVFLVSARPGASFLASGLAALSAATGSTALVLLAFRDGWEHLDQAVKEHLDASAAQVVAVMRRLAGPGAESDPWFGRMLDAVYYGAELQATVYPALVGLASLAGLGVAWWAYRRLACGERAPLGSLRDFRFDDNLVWLIVCGIVLLLLPLGAASFRAGSNMLVFMGALYALRGTAVLVALTGPGPVGLVATATAVMFLFPRVMTAILVLVGLSDTWLDIRRRRRAAMGTDV